MLNIYNSNKIEVISQLLAKELIISPPLITEKLDIAVPNYFLGKWLWNEITVSNQISALYELKTISNYTETLLTNLFPEIDMGVWNFESIKWGIIDSFEELDSYKESLPIRNWINKFLNNKKIIDGDIYNLTKKIANNFIDYLIFRPEMISNWHKYDLNSQNLFNNLNSNEYWQPILFKLLQKKMPEKPSCLYMIEVIKNIKKLQNYKNKIPKCIYIISDNNLSRLHVDFYSKLAEFTKVNLYLLSVGDNLWNRINSIEGEVDFGGIENKLYLNNASIEGIFGKFGANYQKLIEETSNIEDINLNTKSIYIDPTINSSRKKDVPLINQIQKRLIDNKKYDFIINERDDSIIFRGHFNQLSQLEFVRNKIIEILETCEEIKYSDIAIVSPQTGLIKPFLKYIFNNELINGQKLPYFFIEGDYEDSSNIYNFLLNITQLAGEKITLEKIEYFLSQDFTQNIFNFDMKEKEEIILLLNQVGFHWGLDSNERLGEEKNSLEWCINRIILGLIYDKEFNFINNNLKSFSPKNISLDLNKWVKILIKLKEYINLLRGSFSYSVWVKKIKYILNDVNDFHQNFYLEICDLYRVMNNYSISYQSDQIIVLNVFREILISCINNSKYKNESYINKILVSDIEKIRLIPRNTIFLINMNNVYYPRLTIKENINILNKKYSLGDPSVFDREKYFFLELLISCRKQLIVSWVNNDKDNKKLDISYPIKELINYFESFLTIKQRKSIIKYFDYDKQQFSKTEENTFTSHYTLIDKIDWEEKKFDCKNFKLSELIYWFKTPQLYWLNKNNISPKGIFIHHPDDEYVTNFQKSQLVNNLIQKIEIDNHNCIDELKNLNIREQFIENGIIAPKKSIFSKEKEIKDLVLSLATNLSQNNNIDRTYIKSNSNKLEYFIAGEVVIELIHSKLTLKRLSEAWIKLLFISSLDKKIAKTKVIFRKENLYKSEILQSPDPYYARKILEEYINIFKNFSEKCLPLPPESTYKYVEAKMQSKNEKKAFSDRWIGNKSFTKGERDNTEIQLCFGNKKEPNFFFENDKFDDLSLRLYAPLFEALRNK
ncbi:possible exodeoxyribonuclease V subunit C 125 kD polypeptide [Prochlorococcus marinus str. MIT 9515]|uniref:Possible exodeoxyribonuclease V subunit C 125 kD polypeptide n=1 Tax=Prochlorococcus marinus (strain MIT 9515) TaxID=167542 RepID=A2BX92_PROM5|nr:exodeoxyribonuclease V subunit gamma [Prochlorococcus marinus]ABM72403.1 possible exodeoxyribonuclease V subunit C 125 kD polypeptide [Prochlorococcus marinus str. MIT 9515]